MKHIPRFFVSPEQITGLTGILRGPDLKHLTSVLRLHPGDQVELLDGQNTCYTTELLQVNKGEALFKVLSRREVQSEPTIQVFLGAALLRGEKFDYLIQKATELGVYQIFPFTSGRTVSQIAQEKLPARLHRWQKIAQEAAEQSERGKIPLIAGPLSFEDLCSLDDFDLKLICAERGGFPSLKAVLKKGGKPAKILALVGPEGGFTEKEIQLARSKNFTAVSLGKRILRSETASFLLLSNLFYELEDPS